jgi:hypothetical protein
MSIEKELADKLRAQGVRVEERLELLRVMGTDAGPNVVAQRIAALEARIRKASRDLCEKLA